jgi:hypothetical protein
MACELLVRSKQRFNLPHTCDLAGLWPEPRTGQTQQIVKISDVTEEDRRLTGGRRDDQVLTLVSR